MEDILKQSGPSLLSIKDRVRLALAIEVVRNKPTDITLEDYLLSLRTDIRNKQAHELATMSMSAYGAVPQESDWAKRVQAMEERLRRNEMEMARMRGAKGETREWQEKRRASDNDQENGEKLIKRSRSV